MKKLYALLFVPVSLAATGQGYAQVVHNVVASNFQFTPSNFTAVIGDTILFTFGPTPNFSHTTTSVTIPAGAATWDSPLTTAVPSFKYVVTAPGVYNYKCTPHAVTQGMVATFSVSAVTPVKMISFTASSQQGGALLNWETASEENTDRFAVQMSYDGLNFNDVGFTAAAGSSNAVRKYSYQVGNIGSRAAYVYFRLITIDKDAKKQYSDIVLLHNGAVVAQNLIKTFYPNPAQNGDHLYFSFDSDSDAKMRLTIFETSGRKIFGADAIAVKGVNQSHLPMPRMRKGAYFIEFELGNQKQTLPLFVK